MIKGPGITKSNKRKWNESLEMEPKEAVLEESRARPSTSDDIEEAVHFVINSDFNISPRKSIELPRKAFPKKSSLLIHNFMSSDMLEPFRDSLSSKDRLQSPLTLKCTPAVASEGRQAKKQKKDSDSTNYNGTLLPSKLKMKKLTQTPSAKVLRAPRSRSLGNSLRCNEEASSDSDIEIVGVYNKSSSAGMSSSKVNIRRMTNGQAQVSGKKNGQRIVSSTNGQVQLTDKKNSRGYESLANGRSQLSIKKFGRQSLPSSNGSAKLSMKKNEKKVESLTNGQVPVLYKKGNSFESSVNSQEAGIVPVMPSNAIVHHNTTGFSNSMRWLSANGEISVTSLGHSSSMVNGGLLSKSIDMAKKPMFLPELKSQINKKPKGKRELKRLYDNLNEISWAHESSFKNLLRSSPDGTKGQGRIGKTGKNLRNLKPAVKLEKLNSKRAAKVKASQLMARKKSKMARKINQKTQAKLVGENKSTVMENIRKKRLAKQIVNRVDKKSSGTKAVESDTNEDTDILYSLPEQPVIKVETTDTKPKMNLGKTKTDSLKMKNSAVKIKQEVPKVKSSMLKLKTEVQKTKSNIYKLKPDALKQKISGLKFKPDGPKIKSNLLKFKPDDTVGKSIITQIKPEYSPPSTSGLQKDSFSANASLNFKNSDVKSFMKKFDNFEFSQDVQLLQDLYDQNKHLYSNVQKGSKLRVRLQPLEHTNLWSSAFYDDFRRAFLEEAVCRALENRDRDSIAVMYQELLESLSNSQSSKVGGSSNSSRVPKKKRLGEEEALRSSLRQSEGAFRYKEIVVKKHQNYMQVVLVPNEVKQNSLTIEAIKELKDAFLLAKKDPNCNAVLLNSSGKYFCTGLDLSPLVGPNKRQVADELSNAVQDLVLTLGMFTKPVIAAVNGSAIGFGVSLLTYCDVILASDKATFCLPAAKIGYIPEGGVTLTLPQVVGASVASEMFLQGRRLTAEQACRYGLVSEVLWPTQLMNEVIPRLKAIISKPLPVR
ncbi:hypothetical protein JTE90_009065 [Oedothorax gibbosus]|uniref:Chromodomain Y-like protein 2 n=1 Tax=Oedothorax gibbosus TaxID=931172 RepID=A0AAV6V081_9ARAC|nr:hypothetical protein JTE90_009065 [Oedothorax gibbosus]